MFLTSLCRTYGAHNSMSTLPTALPWANLPVRLRRAECGVMKGASAATTDTATHHQPGKSVAWLFFSPGVSKVDVLHPARRKPCAVGAQCAGKYCVDYELIWQRRGSSFEPLPGSTESCVALECKFCSPRFTNGGRTGRRPERERLVSA